MELLKGIEAIDLALFVPAAKTLAITDLHLGYEENMNSQGIFLPRINFSGIKAKLSENVFPATGKLEKIVINGDYKDEFGSISAQEWKEALDMLDFLAENGSEIILVKGNHDIVLGPVAKWRNLRVVDEYFLEKEKILFTHGDNMPSGKDFMIAKTIVIGHEHPCITISDGLKRETYKCFLVGKGHGKNIIVMPSMNQVLLGQDLTREEPFGPVLRDAGKFRVFAVEDEVYAMGKLSGL